MTVATIERLGTTVWPAWEGHAVASAGLPRRRAEPEVRELRARVERYAWHEDEIHQGIAGWTINCYGDDPAGAYVRCWGRSKAAVEACLDQLIAFVEAGHTSGLYPTQEVAS